MDLKIKIEKHIKTATTLIEAFSASEPFANYISLFFAKNKKYGSSDRKNITRFCYAFYRLGKALPHLSVEEKMKIGCFLCNEKPDSVLENLLPELSINLGSEIEKKLELLKIDKSLLMEIFPSTELLSLDIDKETFVLSHLVQPSLFIRVRKNNFNVIKDRFMQNGISIKNPATNCLELPIRTQISNLCDIDNEVVVQDYASQSMNHFLLLVASDWGRLTTPKKKYIWDCCSGSGGKSILAYDFIPNMHIFASDSRKSILANLSKRFEQAGIENYQAQVIDLTKNKTAIENTFPQKYNLFDLIICDAPCTGSGTWGRTPESLCFFDSNSIQEYVVLQKTICNNTLTKLQNGGYFLYITCSVYKVENEDIVNFILEQNPGLLLIEKKIISGYKLRADTMFGALFKLVACC